MTTLLECYAKAFDRRLVRVLGTPIDTDLCEHLLVALQGWSSRYKAHQERPMISDEK